MKISMVVAMAENGVIGRDGGLPWRVSSDLRRFKALTLGKPVVMGRKCYDSIGKPLPGRPNIVVTRNAEFHPDGVIVTHSLQDALERGAAEAEALGADEICVIGGGEIYRAAMPQADLLLVTYILGDIDGDTTFPAIDPSDWEVEHSEDVEKGEKDDFPSRYLRYRRRGSA